MSKADNKELEEAIKSLEKVINAKSGYSYEIALFDFGEYAEAVLKELERLQEENSNLKRANKIYSNSLQNIAPVLLEDYIEKDKIRKKIEENNKLIEECREDEEHCGEIYLYEHANKILEELLEGK